MKDACYNKVKAQYEVDSSGKYWKYVPKRK